MKKVINGDIGGKKCLKFDIYAVESVLNGPLITFSITLISLSFEGRLLLLC